MCLEDLSMKQSFPIQESITNLPKSNAFKLLCEDVTVNGIGDLEAASEVISSIINAPDDSVNAKVLDNVIDAVSKLIDADLRTNNTERQGTIVTQSVFLIS